MSVSQRMGWTLAAAIAGFAAPTCTAGAPAAGPPAILSVAPAAAPIGTRITLAGINFTPDNNTVEIGERLYPVAALDRCERRRANDQLRADARNRRRPLPGRGALPNADPSG